MRSNEYLLKPLSTSCCLYRGRRRYENVQKLTARHAACFEVAHATTTPNLTENWRRQKRRNHALKPKQILRSIILRSSEPANPSQSAPRGHVGFRTVNNVPGSRTVLLGIERPVGGMDRDLGSFLVVAVAVVVVVDVFFDSLSLGASRQ